MSEGRCRAYAPATVANLACGFDVLGLSLEAPGDTVTAELAAEAGLVLASIEGDAGRLPREAEKNTATVAARKLLERHPDGAEVGLRMTIQKGLPLASGMGSSAASAVAAVVAVSHLLDMEAPLPILLDAALEGERLVAGSGHPDNAAACLYGGLVLVRPGHAPEVVRLPVPEGLSLAILRPHLEMSTRDSRMLLGDRVRLEDAVRQWANVGSFVAGLYSDDLSLVSRSLEDAIAEPVRSPYVPGFAQVKRAALAAGALGSSLSGSGPSIFALCRNPEEAEAVSEQMSAAFSEATDLGADVYVSRVSPRGARILQPEESPCVT